LIIGNEPLDQEIAAFEGLSEELAAHQMGRSAKMQAEGEL
jgi:hypothetical protein